MKFKLTSSVLALALLFGTLGLSVSQSAYSDEFGMNRDGGGERRDHRHRPERAFRMGVCVGQALAQAGVTLPAPQPGAMPSPDPATEAAYKAAIQQCRAQFNGTTSTATPAPAPTSAPVPTSTSAPAPEPAPVPSASSTSE